MKYVTIDKKVQELEHQITHNQNRKAEAEACISDTQEAVQKATQELKQALIKDDKKQAQTLQTKIDKMQRDIIRHDDILIQGMDETLEQMEQQLSEAQNKRDEVFAQNASKVLATEKAQHSKLAKELIQSTKRLLCVHQMLRDRGHGDIYPRVIGGGYDTLPGLKIPILNKFERAAFTGSAQVHPGNDVIREMEEKITA